MDATNIISLLGGVAMFLFGMSVMGDSLKKVAGSKMEMILYKLAGNPIKGILLGTGVTAVIQSSSATSVMVVGFVNSGMMQVKQAIGIVLGAILGTSITGWVLALNSLGGGGGVASLFSTEVLTGVVALIGILLWMFGKKAAHKNIGGIMLGFAVLMYGMSMMSGAITPLRSDPKFIDMMTSFSNPVLGVLIGVLVTAVIQSASAAVGILQALAGTGALEFDMAFPILMGIGIGASVPVMLSALGASVNGKRTAFVYLIIDVLGAVIVGSIFYVIVGSIFYIVNAIVHFDFMTMEMNMVSVALTNTLYRLAVVIVLAPAIGLLEKLVVKLFPEGREALEEKADMDKLEPRFLDHPTLALAQSKEVIESMAAKTLESVMGVINARREYSKDGLKRVVELERVIDRYEDKLGNYLFKLTTSDLDEEHSAEVSKDLKVLSDFERMSDHARNIAESIEEIQEKKIVFSDSALKELTILENAIQEITNLTIFSFANNSYDNALRVDPLEEVIDDICDTMKANHVERISRQECTLEHGFVFNDMITDYERISDHCSNIALDVLEAVSEIEGKHAYHKQPSFRHDDFFKNSFAEFKEKFKIEAL